MKISIICSLKEHPVYSYLVQWLEKNSSLHTIELVQDKSELSGGDLLFIISCHQLIGADIRKQYESSLVIHASDLPNGKGWSPHIWQILEGKNEFYVTIFEAEDSIDSGKIWHQEKVLLAGNELFDEINTKLFAVELQLMDFAVNNFHTVVPKEQPDVEGTYYPKRIPSDSELDVQKTIAEQFDLLRVADPDRFPTYINYRGCKYKVSIKKF